MREWSVTLSYEAFVQEQMAAIGGEVVVGDYYYYAEEKQMAENKE